MIDLTRNSDNEGPAVHPGGIYRSEREGSPGSAVTGDATGREDDDTPGNSDQAPYITQPASSAPSQPAPTSGPQMDITIAETAAASVLLASMTPDHRCKARINCKTCRSTPSLPWLPSTTNGNETAKVLVRINARLTQAERLELGHMYNLDRVGVSKKSNAVKREFHDKLRAFLAQHGILDLYNRFAELQWVEEKSRYYRLPQYEA